MTRRNQEAAEAEAQTEAQTAANEEQAETAQTPSDEIRDVQAEATKRAAKEQDEALKAEKDQDTGEVRVTVAAPVPVNPSSTYPGRNTELAENDMRIPTELDLAKRAKFAGSQIPARVHAAGLVDGDGNITVDVEEAPAASQE